MHAQPGQMLSHYRLVEKIGEGGMGVVWKAVDTTLEREVAIKILPDAFSRDPERLRRFKGEAKAVAALNHPNIVTIHSVEDTEGVHFITMELVHGKPLTETITGEGVSLTKFLDIAVPLAEALGAAHQKGIAHRDLKPDNVMVGDDGSLRVLDFGLARLLPDASTTEATMLPTQTVTQEGHILGTMPYMSPEQVQGKNVDHRTDIFALGVIFYEMLSGKRPFKGASSVDLISSILKDTPSSVTDIRPDLPGQAGRLVTRCLEKESVARFQTMVDLRDELEALKNETESLEKRAAPSIAVLPFVDMSPGKDQDYFCEGMAEEIINALTKLDGLRVTSRTSAFGFKESSVDIRTIGKRLGVNHILEGSVRKAGDQLRITAQLVNVADDYHLWSERYDREMKDIFAIQDEIAGNIVQALQITLSPKEKRAIQRARATDVHAYDYYLRGRKFLYRWNTNNAEFAREMFSRAVEIDPTYALAYAGIADCYSFLYMYADSSETNLEQADAASHKALDLDPGLAEAHASRALALGLNRHYDEAEKAFDAAIRLDPANFEAHYFYGRCCFEQGNLEKAARLFERAAKVNQEDYQTPALLAMVYKGLGRQDEVMAANQRVLEVVGRHLELNPDDVRAVYMGAGSLTALGERERGLQWARRALSLAPDDPNTLYNVACCFSLAGDVENAIECLEQAVLLGFHRKKWIESDSTLDILRSHPRFQALLKQLE
jgi:non-specific serine/threonine protein kinase